MTNCARAEQFLLNRLAKNIRHCVVTIYLTLHYITLHYITLHYITLLTFLHFGAFVRFFPHIQIFSRLYNLPPRQAFWSSRRPDSLAINSVKTNYGKFNIRFAAVKVWNDLDENIKYLPLKMFKNEVKLNILQKYCQH